mgnify:CR=1 FL=1
MNSLKRLTLELVKKVVIFGKRCIIARFVATNFS